MSGTSEHWYSPDTGTSCHTVVGKNGKTRNTSLKDARVHKFVPSVTGIIGVLAKPGLDIWKEEQLLKACVEWPFSNEIYDDWKKQVKHIASTTQRSAIDKGHKIHDALENYYKGQKFTKEYEELLMPVVSMLAEKFGSHINWIAEKSFTYNGYGGTCDLHSDTGIVIDFKTKDKTSLKGIKAYDEHGMQLAAYRQGLAIPRAECYNLFISTSTPGEFLLHKWDEKELGRCGKMFSHLFEIWCLIKKYDPRSA